jgi:hypothetical protein
MTVSVYTGIQDLQATCRRLPSARADAVSQGCKPLSARADAALQGCKPLSARADANFSTLNFQLSTLNFQLSTFN